MVQIDNTKDQRQLMLLKLTNNNRYLLMRHGESSANRDGVIASHPKNAINGYGLTPHGVQQAIKSALGSGLPSDTIIVSSDYKRARETAEIVRDTATCKSVVTIEPLLRERNFGAWELSNHSNYKEVWQNDIKHPERSGDNVESVADVLQRGRATIAKLDDLYHGQTILLVSHGDVLQILLSYYRGIEPRLHRSLPSIGNADIIALTKFDT